MRGLRAAVGSGNQRAIARLSLALIAVMVLMALILAGPGVASGGMILAQASGSASPTGGEAVSIQWLNPTQGYDPGRAKPARPSGTPDAPKISDRFDGVDNAYHLVAWVPPSQVPDNALVEAYIKYATTNEQTIATLEPVAGAPGVYEEFWDVPESLPENRPERYNDTATLTVRLYGTAPGSPELTELAHDDQAVQMEHKGQAFIAEDPSHNNPADQANQPPADETVEFVWPTQNGPLGFHRPSKAGLWRAMVKFRASSSATEMLILYSTSVQGTDPKFTRCGQTHSFHNAGYFSPPLHPNNEFGYIETFGQCSLAGKDSPDQVTAIAAVAYDGDKPDRSDVFAGEEWTQDAADVHVVNGYALDPAKMKIELRPVAFHNDQGGTVGDNGGGRAAGPGSASYPTGNRRLSRSDCLEYDIYDHDENDMPVQGVNVDVHLEGPSDQVGFGWETSNGHGGSDYAIPTKAGHQSESGLDCENFADVPDDGPGTPEGTQGDTNVPGGNDVKHRESLQGTGLGGPCDMADNDPCINPELNNAFPGQWRFMIYSAAPGRTTVTAWVDEEPSPADLAEARAEDDDLLEPTEVSTTFEAQWLPEPLKLQFEPTGGGALVGDCQKYVLRARAGNAVVDGINVDIHATGPTSQLSFCDPGGGSPLRAPDKGDHQAESPQESTHPGTPTTQHTEGDTDEAGNLTFGITSPEPGDTTLFAWVDGEPGENLEDDIQQASEVAASATHTWGVSLDQAKIRFVNPSGYAGGAGDRISVKRDADTQYHLVARTDAFEALPGVEFFFSSGGGAFTKIGDAVRIGETDSYEFFWSVGVADGTYTLRAQIAGTSKVDDRTVTVNSSSSGDTPNPQDPGGDTSFETAEITGPIDGTPAAFTKDGLKMTGFASAGANRVRLFYTRSSAGQVRDSAQWIQCGSIDLGTSTEPKRFEGQCRLASGDAASGVSGIAAIAVDCHSSLGCQDQNDQARAQTQFPESGDAHRVFGFSADPIVSLEPAESQSRNQTCQSMVLSLQDQTGQVITDSNVDIHLSGPSDEVSFCDVEGQSVRRAPEGGAHTGSEPDESVHPDDAGSDTHHTEGETNGQGRFTFGITSAGAGDATILAWVDFDEDDVQSADERGDTAIMHWVTPVDRSGGGGCTKIGTAGDDVLIGTSGDDKICGRGGNDILRGRGGNDVLISGRGNDLLVGGKGDDVLRAGVGRDVMRAASGRDQLVGGSGRDRLNGGAQGDRCDGGVGRDKFKKCEKRRR